MNNQEIHFWTYKNLIENVLHFNLVAHPLIIPLYLCLVLSLIFLPFYILKLLSCLTPPFLCSSLCITFFSLLISYLLGCQQIGDDTFQLEPSLLEELTAQIASLASIYHKPGIHLESLHPDLLYFTSLMPIKYQTSNIKYQTSNIKHQISNIKYQISQAICATSSIFFFPSILIL